MMRILFIHRSVGHNLIQQGSLRVLLRQKGFELDDYDNNNGLLTHSDGSIENSAITMPGNNTNPHNLADFFSQWNPILDPYDIVMIKSCYPNSRIKSEPQLADIKKQYQRIFQAFADRPKQRLIVLTSPPLRPVFTNLDEAKRAQQLAAWLMGQASNTIHVYDLHSTLAEPVGEHQGMLKRSYRRLMPWDNHPNRLANQTVAPELVESIALI